MLLRSIFLSSLLLVQNIAHAYDITDAIKATMKNNISLQEAKINLERSKVNLFAASGSFLPNISASSSSGSNLDNLDLSGRGRSDNINISTNIFAGGSGIFSMRAAALSLDSTKINYKRSVANALLNTVQVYQKVIASREIYKVAQQNVENFQKIVKAAEIKLSLGTITRSNLFEAQAKLADALSQKEAKFANMKSVEGQFQYIIGNKPPVQLSKLDIKNLVLPKNYEDFIIQVEKNNPTILIAEKNLKAAEFNSKATKGILLPQVSANVNLSRRSGLDISGRAVEVSGTTYSLNASLPIFSSGSEYVRIKNALLNEDSSFNTRRDTLLQIHQDATEAWNNFSQAKASLKASSDSLKFFEAFMKGAKEEFNLGTKTLTEYLQAQVNYQSAENNLIEIKATVILYALNLKALLGEIDTVDFSKLVVK